MAPLNVRAVRIHYRHWGRYSGFNQLLRHLDPSRIAVDTQTVPLQPEKPRKLDRFSKDLAESLSGGRCVNWYTSIDLGADLLTSFKAMLKRIDVVHYLDGEHSLGPLPDFLRENRLLRHRPRVVATFHQPPAWLEEIVTGENLRSVDRITVVSREQEDFFRRLAPGCPVSFIPHGVDIDFFRPGPRRDGDGAFRCLTVGSWMRNMDIVLAIAKRMSGRAGLEFHLVSPDGAGAGPSNVSFHRNVSDEALRDLYRSADLLLMPLHDCTANNALLEGIACGVPVAATDLPGVRDYLPGDEAVRIDAQACPAVWEETILRLRDNPDSLDAMSKSARARAERYDWRRIASSFEALYAEVVSADQ